MIIAVDSSKKDLSAEVQLVKVAVVFFEGKNLIKSETKLQLLSSSEELRNIEAKVAKELYQKYEEATILFDGPINNFENEKVIGICKEGEFYRKINLSQIRKEMKDCFYKLNDESFLFSLSRRLPIFRVDYKNVSFKEALEIVKFYSKNNLIFGYPLPLYLAHKFCLIGKDEEEVYKLKAFRDFEELLRKEWMRGFRW